ncbi:metal ABC transporter substrate-binding protein [Niallia nealsonii]|uniref:Zinc ABC transporter substrate-binding protein n=1 Tax=Niallia nealsonii TaxID=115979 RepID=A0A2N0YWV1_9BACI|nr:metal ABC transporter substrate-binding protein [Niallia nealsonii]PKG21730.1 zinc ABC transporter substrate-binding protein [Niallia nealsonii]
MRKSNRLKTLLIGAAAIILLAGCGNKKSVSNSNENKEKSKTEKIKIVTTFYPMYEFTKQIAGDAADVELLIPSTMEPHDWEPTPKDMGNIQNASLFIYNSEYMETWAADIKKSVRDSKVKFIEASKGITLEEGEEEHEHEHEEENHEHEHTHAKDPHVWLSPVLAQKEVATITDALINADPSYKEVYEKNSEAYIEDLKELDNKYRTALQNVTKKELITQHAAFHYLTNEYGMAQVPIAGLSPDEEPSAQKLAELQKFAKEHNVKVIYFEELASPKIAKTLALEIGAKTEVLSTLEGISEEDQKKGMDYISVMENNLEKLVEHQK